MRNFTSLLFLTIFFTSLVFIVPETLAIYGCVADNNKYACSPGNKSDCSDVSACAGKSCKLIDINLCGKASLYETTVVFTPPTANTDFVSFVKSIAAWLYKLAIPIAVIAVIYSGVLMLISQGNAKLIDRGKKMLLYAVIGLIILLIGRGFFTLIKSILDLGK